MMRTTALGIALVLMLVGTLVGVETTKALITPTTGNGGTATPTADHQLLFETAVDLVSTPAPGIQISSVVKIDLPEGTGYPEHQHQGSSVMVISSGQVCLAQISASVPVTVVRFEPRSGLTEVLCQPIDDDCADGDCQFDPCLTGCQVSADTSVWLGVGDTVVQSVQTDHAYVNVGEPGEHAVLLNSVVGTITNEGGCVGDCT